MSLGVVTLFSLVAVIFICVILAQRSGSSHGSTAPRPRPAKETTPSLYGDADGILYEVSPARQTRYSSNDPDGSIALTEKVMKERARKARERELAYRKRTMSRAAYRLWLEKTAPYIDWENE